MPEVRPGPGPEEAPLALGALQYFWFDGLLAGAQADESVLGRVARGIADLGLGAPGVEVDGRRFAVHPDGAVLPGERLTETVRAGFRGALQAVVDALPEPGEAESTLRCTEVFEHGTRETLYAVVGRQVLGLSRVRGRTDRDLARDPRRRGPSAIARLGRGRLAAVAVLLLAALGVALWRSPIRGLIFGPENGGLVVDRGPFGAMLRLTLEPAASGPRLRLERGPDYPASAADRQRLGAGDSPPATRAVLEALTGDDGLWVRIEAQDGRILGAVRADVGPLRGDPRGVVVCPLPPVRGPARIVLALDAGR